MSNEADPKVAWLSDTEWKTELAAVWYAANFYYAASARRKIEYAGIVFRKPNGMFGITVRNGYKDRDGSYKSNRFDAALIRWRDTPHGSTAVAAWHTHLPETLRVGAVAGLLLEAFGQLLGAIDESLGMSYAHFSDADRNIAEQVSKKSIAKGGQRVSIYLITDTLIKRYTPGTQSPVKSWPKEPPKHLGAKR